MINCLACLVLVEYVNTYKEITLYSFILLPETGPLLNKIIILIPKTDPCLDQVIKKMENWNLQGDKKQANPLFLREIIQPNLPKFAYNLVRGRRVRI